MSGSYKTISLAAPTLYGALAVKIDECGQSVSVARNALVRNKLLFKPLRLVDENGESRVKDDMYYIYEFAI